MWACKIKTCGCNSKMFGLAKIRRVVGVVRGEVAVARCVFAVVRRDGLCAQTARKKSCWRRGRC